jgi:hypothetical protein
LRAVRSVLSDEKKLSIAALSQTLPDRHAATAPAGFATDQFATRGRLQSAESDSLL